MVLFSSQRVPQWQLNSFTKVPQWPHLFHKESNSGLIPNSFHKESHIDNGTHLAKSHNGLIHLTESHNGNGTRLSKSHNGLIYFTKSPTVAMELIHLTGSPTVVSVGNPVEIAEA